MKKYILLASRIGSYLIDYILFLGLVYIVGKKGVVRYAACLLAFFLYRFLVTAIYGATVGMMLLKLTLDKHDIKICFKREVFRFASAFYFIGYFYGILDSLGRTFHDIAAGTFVRYRESEVKEITKPKILKYFIYLLLVISVVKWSTGFLLNQIGNIGLNRLYSSEEYYQSFEGDNLISYSQQELYLNTLGRKYTAIMDFRGIPHIIRISNKLKYTEVYKLNIGTSKIYGEYAFKINIPLQFICSGIFRKSQELCGISPKKELIISDEIGRIVGKANVNLQNIINLKCGDLDNDGRDDIVALGRNGDVQFFSFKGGKLKSIYNKKIGEDIVPQAFYIDNGIVVAARGHGKSIIYSYKYNGRGFDFNYRRNIAIAEISNMVKQNDNIIISNINRNNMMFGIGNIQRFEMYSMGDDIKRIYNFGSRPAKRYDFLVRNLEDIHDINHDGKEEIIVKAVEKDDVMGQGYIVEIYEFNKTGLRINRVLTFLEGLLAW